MMKTLEQRRILGCCGHAGRQCADFLQLQMRMYSLNEQTIAICFSCDISYICVHQSIYLKAFIMHSS